jgi:PKD domain
VERAPLGGAEKQSALARGTVHSGDLTVTLTATPGRAKTSATIQFKVTASAQRASGALGYQLRYGDGTSAENVVPQFCIAGRGTPVLQAWHLSHRYKVAGHYRVSVSVDVNCSGEHGSATAVVSIA